MSVLLLYKENTYFEDILINIENVYSVIYRELSGRVLDSRPRDRQFEHHRRHCVVSLTKNINPSLVLVIPGRPVHL